MRSLRRKEKAIKTRDEMIRILEQAQYITIAMCLDDQPYLATLSHGYDRERNCLYFHCAQEGKKVDILRQNNAVWGQALLDKGYVQGACDHLFGTTQFRGNVTFVDAMDEKRHALEVMIEGLEGEPGKVKATQLTEEAITRVLIGRIDIDTMSGKKSEEVIISP